jgi:hypothetical protein
MIISTISAGSFAPWGLTLLIGALATPCLVLHHRVVSDCACKDDEVVLEDEHMDLRLCFGSHPAQNMLLACRDGTRDRAGACSRGNGSIRSQTTVVTGKARG